MVFAIPEMRGTTLQLSEEVKYLGVIPDKKLLWNKHIEVKMKRAVPAYGLCRRTFTLTWKLRLQVVMWIYDAIIRPMLAYASLVCWCVSVCLVITGALVATSGAALNALPNLQLLHLFIQSTAVRAAHRLIRWALWRNNGLEGTEHWECYWQN